MYFYLVIIAIILAGIAYVAILRGKVKSLKLKLKAETERADTNAAEVKQREHIIKALQGAFKNENEKKKKLHTGSDADKFAASLDILSNKTASKTS